MSNTALSDKGYPPRGPAAGLRRIYLDHAATAPTDPEVLRAMLPYFDARWGNPSSLHESGRRAAGAIARARERVANVLGCTAGEILFTGSGTESDNLAVLGAARAARERGRHVIVSPVEHKAVLEAARSLEREGFSVSILPVNRHGLVDVEECLRLLTKRTVLVSVMYANNEVGTIEPVRALAAALRTRRRGGYPLFHTDACQAAGALPIDVGELDVDLMTLNGSKIYGPKGVGVLYRRKGVVLEPVVVGGEQEMFMRAGTESVPLIMGFAEALERAEAMRQDESARLAELRDYFLGRLRETLPQARLNGHPVRRLPNNAHISIPGVEGEAMVLMLDRMGVEASTGSACSAFDLSPSHVLLAMGQVPELAHGSLRLTLGRATTKEDLECALLALRCAAETLARICPARAAALCVEPVSKINAL